MKIKIEFQTFGDRDDDFTAEFDAEEKNISIIRELISDVYYPDVMKKLFESFYPKVSQWSMGTHMGIDGDRCDMAHFGAYRFIIRNSGESCLRIMTPSSESGEPDTYKIEFSVDGGEYDYTCFNLVIVMTCDEFETVRDILKTHKECVVPSKEERIRRENTLHDLDYSPHDYN